MHNEGYDVVILTDILRGDKNETGTSLSNILKDVLKGKEKLIEESSNKALIDSTIVLLGEIMAIKSTPTQRSNRSRKTMPISGVRQVRKL